MTCPLILSEEDKEILLRAPTIELDGSVDDDVERAWLEQAHRRMKEPVDGSVKPIPVALSLIYAHHADSIVILAVVH